MTPTSKEAMAAAEQAVSEIVGVFQRYDLVEMGHDYSRYQEMAKRDDGDWVSWDDHAALVSFLTAERAARVAAVEALEKAKEVVSLALLDARAQQRHGRQKYGGSPDNLLHDDNQDQCDWVNFIKDHATRAELGTPQVCRDHLVKVAGLALSAVEAFDRRGEVDQHNFITDALALNAQLETPTRKDYQQRKTRDI